MDGLIHAVRYYEIKEIMQESEKPRYVHRSNIFTPWGAVASPPPPWGVRYAKMQVSRFRFLDDFVAFVVYNNVHVGPSNFTTSMNGLENIRKRKNHCFLLAG